MAASSSVPSPGDRSPRPNATRPNATRPNTPRSHSEQLLLKGSRFDVYAMTLTGNDGKTYMREVIRHPGAVVLLPLIDRDTVVLSLCLPFQPRLRVNRLFRPTP